MGVRMPPKSKRKTKKPVKKARPKKKAKKPKAVAKAPPPKPEQKVSRPALAKVFGVTTRQVTNWISDDCPIEETRPGKSGGRPQNFFMVSDVSDWLAAMGITPPKLPEIERQTIDPLPLKPSELSDAEHDAMNQLGLVGAVSRMRTLELQAFRAMESEHRKTPPNMTTLRALQKLYADSAEGLRKIEKELPAILQARGEMIPVETACSVQAEINLAIKTEFLQMPSKLAQRCAEETHPGKVEKLLNAEVRNILRHLASGG